MTENRIQSKSLKQLTYLSFNFKRIISNLIYMETDFTSFHEFDSNVPFTGFSLMPNLKSKKTIRHLDVTSTLVLLFHLGAKHYALLKVVLT